MDYIKLSIPIFFLLIGVELLIDRIRKTNYYRFNDAVTNLSCGIGSQLAGIFLKVLTFGGYLYIYNNHSLFSGAIPFTWWSVLVLFVGVDFFYYWFHRLAHEISVLWGSHIVHHQSEEYNLTVALRQAWLQGAFSWVFYIPLAFIGFEPLMFATVASFQTLYQFWIHTKFINKMHPAFEYVFNTPSHHRVHHGVNPQYIDKNHGGTLIIFDRMFGTFQPEEEAVVYGITKQPKSWNPIWVNFEYWIDLFQKVFLVKRFSDKMKMLFGTPGWKPEALGGGEIAQKTVTPATFQKYDTVIPASLNRYVFIHFVLIVAGTSLFLFSLNQFTWAWKIYITAMIIFSLTLIGGIFESKKWVLYLEYMRLFLISLTFFIMFYNRSYFWMVFTAQSFLFILSILWISKYFEVFTNKAEWKFDAV